MTVKIDRTNFEKATIKIKILVLIPAVLFSILFAEISNAAADSKPSGREIARRMYDRDIGKDSFAKIKMLLIDKRGHKKFRSMITAKKEYGNLEKSYIRFTAPADIENTAFLTWENKDRDDDQFLYLPALKRVRRIVASRKKSRFVNTDYTYEDMQNRKVDEDHHRLINQEKCMGYDCWVIESRPVDPENSQYARRISWVVKGADIPVKTEFYDKRGRKIKQYRAARLKKIDGIWTATEYEMHDLKRRHRTLMKLAEIRYNSGLEDRIFTKTYLQYGR